MFEKIKKSNYTNKRKINKQLLRVFLQFLKSFCDGSDLINYKIMQISKSMNIYLECSKI